MAGAPEPGYFINERKWIDPSGWVIIQRRYLENGIVVVEKEMRAATAEDVWEAGQEANLFDEGAGPQMYREANVTELDSSEEEETLTVDSAASGREVTLWTPPSARAHPRTPETIPAATAGPSRVREEEPDAPLLDLQGSFSELDSEDEPLDDIQMQDSSPAPGNPSPAAQGSFPSSAASGANPVRQARQKRRNKKRKQRKRATDLSHQQKAQNAAEKPSEQGTPKPKKARSQGATAMPEAMAEGPPPPEDKFSGRSTSSEGSYCPMCRQRVSVRAKRHAEANHLPWWITPDRACWTCRRRESSLSNLLTRHANSCSQVAMTEEDATTWVHLCNGLLQVIRRDLGCKTNAELLSRVVARRYYPQDRSPFHLSLDQKLLFRLWEQKNGYCTTALSDMAVKPPSVVACLLHPKVLVCILPHLKEETARAILNTEAMPRSEAPPQQLVTYQTVDAHIHLDQWGKDFARHLGKFDDSRVKYTSLIANFAHPKRWSAWDAIADEDLVCAFGIHPVVCAREPGIVVRKEGELRRRLASPRCVALGEIGLDYLRCQSDKQRTEQRQSLYALLRLRPDNLPIVIHCRGGGEALQDCLRILRDRVPATTIVQVHCFLGGRAEVGKWQEAFPQCLFSLSHRSLALVGTEAAEHQLAVRSLSLDRILVESDAPFLGRSAEVQRTSAAPASPRLDLYQVGEWIGRQKGLCPSVILQAAGLNAQRAFRIPPGCQP